MIMVGPSQPILDDQHAVIGKVTADDIEKDRTDLVLDSCKFKIDAERICESVHVVPQPWGEVRSLVRPHLSRLDWDKLADIDGHSASFLLEDPPLGHDETSELGNSERF